MEITLNQENFESEVIKSQIPILVDFWAKWCGPCLAIAPALTEIAGQYQGKASVGKLNVDDALPGSRHSQSQNFQKWTNC